MTLGFLVPFLNILGKALLLGYVAFVGTSLIYYPGTP